MKKLSLLFLFLLLFLTSCATSISETLYVSSYCISISDNMYKCDFFMPSSASLGKSKDKASDENYIATVSAKSIYGLYKEIDEVSRMKMNFRQVKSVIFHKSFLNEKALNEFFEVLSETKITTFNFYCFATEIEGKELYKAKNPNMESDINTIISNPNNCMDLYIMANPLFFLKFSEYVLSDKTVLIPSISTKKIWNDDTSYICDGLCIYNGMSKFYYKKDDTFLNVFKNNEYLEIEGCIYKEYKFSFDIKKHIVNIDAITFSDINTAKEVIYKAIDKAYNIVSSNDILNLKNINYKYNQNITYDDITFNVSMKKILI